MRYKNSKADEKEFKNIIQSKFDIVDYVSSFKDLKSKYLDEYINLHKQEEAEENKTKAKKIRVKIEALRIKMYDDLQNITKQKMEENMEEAKNYVHPEVESSEAEPKVEEIVVEEKVEPVGDQEVFKKIRKDLSAYYIKTFRPTEKKMEVNLKELKSIKKEILAHRNYLYAISKNESFTSEEMEKIRSAEIAKYAEKIEGLKG